MVFMKKSSCKGVRLVAVLLALAILFLCGCGGEIGENPDDTSMPDGSTGPAPASPTPAVPKNGGTLKLSVGPYDTVNPLRTSNEDVRLYMCAFVCENLVDIDADMMPSPHVFTSWSCDDTSRIWEFEMARNVTFHSGGEAVASDVKNMIDNIVGFGGNYAENVRNVAGCFVKDKYIVQVMLKEPDAMFVNKLAIPLVGWQTFASDEPVVMDGTGIFKTTEFGDERILLEKNTLYRDRSKLTYYNTVDIGVCGSENEKVNSDFDFCLIQGASVGASILREGTSVYYYGGTGYDYIAVNCATSYVLGSGSQGEGEGKNYITLANPFSEKRLRQALNLVVSRENVVRSAASGHGSISLLPLYSGTAYRKQQNPDYPYSPERAVALLKEIGYANTDAGWFKDGEELVVRAICPKRNFRMLTVMREAAEGLRGIGVTVELAELSDADYLERLNNREYMIAAVESELGVWQDCSAIFGTSGKLNYSFYSDAKVDGYLEQLSLHSDPGVAAAAFARIEEIVIEDCPIVGLFIADNALIVSDRIKGVREEVLRPWNPLASIGEWWIEE